MACVSVRHLHNDVTRFLRILFLRPVSEDWGGLKGKDTNSYVGNFQGMLPGMLPGMMDVSRMYL